MYLQKETSIMCCFLVVQNRLSIIIHIWLISFGQKLIICLAFLSNQFGQTARFQCKQSTRDVKQLPDQFIDQSILSITCIAWSEPYMIFIFQALRSTVVSLTFVGVNFLVLTKIDVSRVSKFMSKDPLNEMCYSILH